MTTPAAFQSSNYPDDFDDDQNLFLVHDSLKVVLAEDYDPEDDDTQIVVEGDITNFPQTGIITLTEQCSEITKRAVSFYYTSHTTDTFLGLVPLDGFDNTIVRPKKRTYVTQNVMASHHNCLKDALIAIEEFVGVKGTTDTTPFGETIEGRINFLRKLVLSPRAWFSADKRVGLVPLEVTFKNESFRLGDGNVVVTWDFGDASSSIPISSLSNISVTSVTPISTTDVRVVDIDSGEIVKTYTRPNKYTVTLTVENEFGSDSVVFEDFITARTAAPDRAVVEFSATSEQILTAGVPVGGPFDEETPPRIRSRTNKFINLTIPEGINPSTLRTYSGEEVEGATPIDPVVTYTWMLSDDLEHSDSRSAVASYSVGGLYDMTLRCDTEFGAYRITNYSQAFDIVEEQNMWLFTLPNGGNQTYANEFGLISETFKTGTTPYTIRRDWGFLNDTNNEEQAVREFKKNAQLAPNSAVASGNAGSSLIVYAGGCGEGDPLSTHQVRVVEFEGFAGTISENPIEIFRPWNWVFFPFTTKGYFLFGPEPDAITETNDAYETKDVLNMNSITLGTPVTLTLDNYVNGAEELREHVTSDYDGFGEPENGRFAVYRSTVRESTGYFLRNEGVGAFFKIRNFYRTEGTSATPVTNIRKLPDMAGQVKTEGELVALTSGIWFFNNSGNINAYNLVDGVWETANSTAAFRNYQDTTVDGYDDKSNTLIACSDGERNAYLSYDYSTTAFIKYNSVDFTFSLMTERPEGEQWLAGIY
jgi:PKD repeat protein